MADYGLDPMTQGFIQGGAVYPYAIETPEYPQTGPMVPPPPPPPPPQRASTEYNLPLGSIVSAPPPPPPPPTQKFGRGATTLDEAPMAAGSDTSPPPPGDISPWLHPDVAAAVQNGFVTQPSQVAPMVPATSLITQPNQAVPPDDSQHVSPKEMLAAQKANAANAAKQSAFNASPEGIAESADAQNRAALDKERGANADAYAAEAAQNDATSAALKAHGERVAKQAEIDQAKTAQDQANVEKYTQIYAQQIKDAADYKVDTNRDIGTRGLIAIALSGIGDALDHRHGPNTALQILDGDIDKRIADQWAKKKALGDKAAGAKDVLGVYRNNADDDRQAMQFQRAAESAKLADEIRQIGAQYANPAAKARAEAIAAGLDQKAATITQGEATRKAAAIREAQEEADRKAHLQLAQGQLGVAYSELGLRRQAQQDARTDNDRNFALKVAELEEKGQGAKAAAVQKQREEVYDRGVMVPPGTVQAADGKLNADTQPLTRKDGTPYLLPKERAKDLGEQLSAYGDAIDAADKLRRLRRLGGGHLTENEEALQTTQEYARYLLALHESGGIKRLSGEAVDLFKEVASGGRNPNSLRAVMDTLDNGRGDLIAGYNQKLKGAQYDGPPVNFPDPLKLEGAAELPGQDTVKSILKFDARRPQNAEAKELKNAGLPPTFVDSSVIPPSYQKALDAMGKTATDPKASKEARDLARANLKKIMGEAGAGSIRTYAWHALGRPLSTTEDE